MKSPHAVYGTITIVVNYTYLFKIGMLHLSTYNIRNLEMYVPPTSFCTEKCK